MKQKRRHSNLNKREIKGKLEFLRFTRKVSTYPYPSRLSREHEENPRQQNCLCGSGTMCGDLVTGGKRQDEDDREAVATRHVEDVGYLLKEIRNFLEF